MTPEIIVTKMKKRYSGVSGTINVLLPVQARDLSVGFLGTDIPGVDIAVTECGRRFSRVTL